MTARIVTPRLIGVPALVMNIFVPLISHAVAARRRAWVRMDAASQPAVGSVRPKAPRARPATRSGSQRCCWSSEPNWKIGLVPRPTAADSVMPTDWSTRPSSSMARHKVVKSAPLPPHCSGNTRPNSPRSAMARTTSIGKTWSRSHCSAWGAISASGEVTHDEPEGLVLVGEVEVHRPVFNRRCRAGASPRSAARRQRAGIAGHE